MWTNAPTCSAVFRGNQPLLVVVAINEFLYTSTHSLTPATLVYIVVLAFLEKGSTIKVARTAAEG